jgi:hypothetical protein
MHMCATMPTTSVFLAVRIAGTSLAGLPLNVTSSLYQSVYYILSSDRALRSILHAHLATEKHSRYLGARLDTTYLCCPLRRRSFQLLRTVLAIVVRQHFDGKSIAAVQGQPTGGINASRLVRSYPPTKNLRIMGHGGRFETRESQTIK